MIFYEENKMSEDYIKIDKAFNENNGDFYDLEYYLSLEYRRFSGAHSSFIKNFLKILKDLNFEGKKVLDVGCGGGFFTNEMARLGAEVIGCDYSQFAVQFAKERYPDLKIIQHSAYQIDKLGINNLDLIFALDIIEHMSQPEIFFEKALKILNPREGRLVITTDNENYFFLKKPFNHLRNILLRTSSGGRAYRLISKVEASRRQFKNYHRSHINIVPPNIWIDKLKKSGFQIEKATTYPRISIPILDLFFNFLPLFRRGDSLLIVARISQYEPRKKNKT